MRKILGNPFLTLGNIANFGIIGNRKTVLRFQATESGRLIRFNWWWRAREAGFQNTEGSWSYSAGDGGVYRVSLQGDSRGKPNGTTLDQATFVVDLARFPTVGPKGANNSFRPVNFSGNALVEKGNWYNIVFENTHNDPFKNYVSLNGTFSRNKDYRGHGFLINEFDGDTWKTNSGSLTYLPAWAMTLDNGRQIGQPFQYGEYWTGQYSINGMNRVEQVMKVRESIELRRLHVWATRLHGQSPLRANIFVDDQWLVYADFAASRVPQLDMPQQKGKVLYSGTSTDFEYYQQLSADIGKMQLLPGQEVRVQFLTPDDTRYYIPSSVRAGGYTGINATQLSTPGAARFSIDSGQLWYNWQMRSGQSTDSIALSAYFA